MNRTLLAIVLMTAAALPAAAEPLIERLRADAARITADRWAVTRTFVDNRGETRHRVARWDPRREDRPWSLLARNYGEPSADYAARYHGYTDRPGPNTYGIVANYLGAGAERIAETETGVTYRAARLGPGSIILGDQDVSDKIAAEIDVNTAGERPFVEEVRMTVVEDFKPHWAARITEGTGVARFALDPQGRPVMVSERFEAKGSKPFGRLKLEMQSLYRDHEYLGERRSEAGADRDGAD